MFNKELMIMIKGGKDLYQSLPDRTKQILDSGVNIRNTDVTIKLINIVKQYNSCSDIQSDVFVNAFNTLISYGVSDWKNKYRKSVRGAN